MGFETHFQGTPLLSMGTEFLASLQSCCMVFRCPCLITRNLKICFCCDKECKLIDKGILGWCNIFTFTIFHHPTHTNVNICTIPVYPLGCIVHAKHSIWVYINEYYICVCPLRVLENGGMSECNTRICSKTCVT